MKTQGALAWITDYNLIEGGDNDICRNVQYLEAQKIFCRKL